MTPPGTTSPGVGYIVPIVDFANPPAAPPNMTIVACQSGDLNCRFPGMPPIQAPDPAVLALFPEAVRPAVLQITLPTGFDGYLRITAMGYVQTEYYFGGPLIGGMDGGPGLVGEAIPVPRDNTVSDIFGSLRRERDTSRGLIALRTLNCLGQRAPNVTLDLLNTDAIGWTLISNAPASPQGQNDAFIPTDIRGVAGFANIIPGAAVVEGHSPAGVPYGQANFAVRANQLTIGEIRLGQAVYGR
jgi:hypothetical protein